MQEDKNQANQASEQESRKGALLSAQDFFKRSSRRPINSSTLLKLLPYIIAATILLSISIFAWINLNKLDKKIAILEEEIKQVESRYKRDSTEYHDLKKTPSLIEHIAREDYYMKSEGEEIYVIKEAETKD